MTRYGGQRRLHRLPRCVQCNSHEPDCICRPQPSEIVAGPPQQPTGVDHATTELWKSLGIHVPPTVLRESREYHESALHGIFTTIALKLEELTKNTEDNRLRMATQKDVNRELAQLRAAVSSQEAKVLNAAKATSQAGVASMSDRIDRQNKKLALMTQQQMHVWDEVKHVKAQLAEDEALDGLLGDSDVDVINMQASEAKMQELFSRVADVSHEADVRMEQLLVSQTAKDREMEELKSSLQSQETQNAKMARMSANREAKLYSEMSEMKAASDMTSSDMAEFHSEQAGALGAANIAAAKQIEDMKRELQASTAGALGVDQADASERERQLQALEQRLQLESQAQAMERKEFAAAADQARSQMESEIAAKLEMAMAATANGNSSSDEVAALIEQQQKMLQQQAEMQKQAALASEAHAASQVALLAEQLETERQARSSAQTDDASAAGFVSDAAYYSP